MEFFVLEVLVIRASILRAVSEISSLNINKHCLLPHLHQPWLHADRAAGSPKSDLCDVSP